VSIRYGGGWEPLLGIRYRGGWEPLLSPLCKARAQGACHPDLSQCQQRERCWHQAPCRRHSPLGHFKPKLIHPLSPETAAPQSRQPAEELLSASWQHSHEAALPTAGRTVQQVASSVGDPWEDNVLSGTSGVALGSPPEQQGCAEHIIEETPGEGKQQDKISLQPSPERTTGIPHPTAASQEQW